MEIIRFLIEKNVTDKFFITQDFISSWKEKNFEEALNIRKKAIIQAEKKFIESFNMKYEGTMK